MLTCDLCWIIAVDLAWFFILFYYMSVSSKGTISDSIRNKFISSFSFVLSQIYNLFFNSQLLRINTQYDYKSNLQFNSILFV